VCTGCPIVAQLFHICISAVTYMLHLAAKATFTGTWSNCPPRNGEVFNGEDELWCLFAVDNRGKAACDSNTFSNTLPFDMSYKDHVWFVVEMKLLHTKLYLFGIYSALLHIIFLFFFKFSLKLLFLAHQKLQFLL
jgi:hypothetical protein